MRDGGWDRWAGVYHALERLLFGQRLQQTREVAARLADRLVGPRETSLAGDSRGAPPPWLVVGDGDGRGLASLLAELPEARFVSVDRSPAMLRRASARMTGARPERVTLIRATLPDGPGLDALPDAVAGIVTCFFLDCFTQPELARVWERLAGRVPPGGIWVVADFTPPERLRGWRRVVQHGLLGLLYRAFGWTTSMRARAMPELDTPFLQAGWDRVIDHPVRSGLTRVVVWKRPSARDPWPGKG